MIREEVYRTLSSFQKNAAGTGLADGPRQPAARLRFAALGSAEVFELSFILPITDNGRPRPSKR